MPTRQAVFVRGVSVVDVWLICYYYPASSGVGDGGPARQAVCARGISVTTGGYYAHTIDIRGNWETVYRRDKRQSQQLSPRFSGVVVLIPSGFKMGRTR